MSKNKTITNTIKNQSFQLNYQKPLFRDQTCNQFLCMLPTDSIYCQTSDLSISEAKFMIAKILGDLNYLLYTSFDEFWKTLQINMSLKKCLESCLNYFNRKDYNQTHREEGQPMCGSLELCRYHTLLVQTVFKIYHRIIFHYQENKKMSQKLGCAQIIYEHWLLDMPKIFNFMAIYGLNNPKIVKVMVKAIFDTNQSYFDDYADCLQIMEERVVSMLSQDFANYATNNVNLSQKEELRAFMKTILETNDVMVSLTHVFRWFPLKAWILTFSYQTLIANLLEIYYSIYAIHKNVGTSGVGQKVQCLLDDLVAKDLELFAVLFVKMREYLVETNEEEIHNYEAFKQQIIDICRKLIGRLESRSTKLQTYNFIKNLIKINTFVQTSQLEWQSLMQDLVECKVLNKMPDFGVEQFDRKIHKIEAFRQQYLHQDNAAEERVLQINEPQQSQQYERLSYLKHLESKQLLDEQQERQWKSEQSVRQIEWTNRIDYEDYINKSDEEECEQITRKPKIPKPKHSNNSIRIRTNKQESNLNMTLSTKQSKSERVKCYKQKI